MPGLLLHFSESRSEHKVSLCKVKNGHPRVLKSVTPDLTLMTIHRRNCGNQNAKLFLHDKKAHGERMKSRLPTEATQSLEGLCILVATNATSFAHREERYELTSKSRA